ncbi:MAG: lipid-A-disaccharide synthase [Planctomycetes bacterium RBG_19FT_COMBO_48_8]|nr:MAG: lipid-A-disaccharide synthase [Planctomycetes bacterium RBG_19FT_COMBO_48_8]
MPNKDKKYRVFISAAEPSADAHCAGLIAAMQKSRPGIEFVGVGGPKMAQAGCELLENTVDKAAMIYKAFSQVARFYKIIKRISRYLKSNNVDLVIVCDSPSFNFHVAKAAKKASIKTLFFVAPQLWAWGGWRIRKLRKRCDKLCCLLPFEQDWFGQRGMDAVFVGNPLLDKLEIAHTRHEQYEDFEPEHARFALMPGSRAAEIESLWQPMQQIALRLKEKYPAATFTAVAVDARREEILRATQIPGFECQYSIDSVNKTALAVDFSIVASGSATLEVAAAGCPMVIMYQSSRILWYLFGWAMNTKYLSLVNILSCRELVPEFMPHFISIDPIVASIERLLQDNDKLAQLSVELTRLTEPLAEKKACREVANIAIEMLH